MNHSGTGHESTQSPRQAIEDASKIDYAFGFTISQGGINIQRVHYSLLRPYYAHTWEQSDLTSVADQYEADHRATIPKIPVGHAKYASRVPVPQEFAERWTDFSDRALRGKERVDDTNIEWARYLTARFMIVRDIEKITAGRAAENTFADPHASFFRNYVLLGAPTNSPAFDASLADIKSQVQTSELMAHEDVAKLQSVWAEWHPGEQFIPKG